MVCSRDLVWFPSHLISKFTVDKSSQQGHHSQDRGRSWEVAKWGWQRAQLHVLQPHLILLIACNVLPPQKKWSFAVLYGIFPQYWQASIALKLLIQTNTNNPGTKRGREEDSAPGCSHPALPGKAAKRKRTSVFQQWATETDKGPSECISSCSSLVWAFLRLFQMAKVGDGV